MTLSSDLPGARAYALRLLKLRPRSEKEIRDKLKKKGYGAQVIEELIAYLKKARFLDDALFARLWVESRVKRSYGAQRLRYELKQKGIDAETIERTLESLSGNYDEERIVGEIVARKIKKMQGVSPQKIKARLYGFLVRRGFQKHVIIEALLKYVPPQDMTEDLL